LKTGLVILKGFSDSSAWEFGARLDNNPLPMIKNRIIRVLVRINIILIVIFFKFVLSIEIRIDDINNFGEVS
jgi:hypothetical protein